MNTELFIAQTKEFRSSTGLPLSSSYSVLTASAACTTEELTELADAMGDSIVTLAGIALQCTDEAKIDICIDKIKDIETAAALLKIDIKTVMNKIYTANMSKLCDTEQQAIETQSAYILDGVNSYVEPVGDYFAVYSDDNQTSTDGKFFPRGKLLKNLDWSEPDCSNISEWLKDQELVSVLTEDLE